MADSSTPSADNNVPPPDMMPLHQEFMLFLKENKKWWLLPMITMVALLGLVLAFSTGVLAPFIYPLL